MIVRAVDLPPEGLRIDRPIRIGPLAYEGGLEIGLASASLDVRVRPTGRGLLCAGRIVAQTEVPCSRCLERYPLPVDRPFEVTYLSTPPSVGGCEAELQIGREDLDVSFLDKQGSLDTDDLATEQIYLALPMKPLCSEGCRGLCPGCGVNLNREACHCRPTA